MSLFGKNKPKTQEVLQVTPKGEEYLQHVREEMKDAVKDHPMCVSLSPGMYEYVEIPVEKPKRQKHFGLF